MQKKKSMLNKIMFSIQKRSVTVLRQATWGAEAKGRICTTDLELEELKNPASSAPLWPCVLGLWGGQRYSKIWTWKPFQALVLLAGLYDLCGSKEHPEKSTQQSPPTPEDLSSEEELDTLEVELICMIRPVAAENLGIHYS